MQKLWIGIILSVILTPFIIQQGFSLIQYGTEVELELLPGESETFEWAFRASEKDTTLELQMGSYGWGSQFFSYPETIHVPANELATVEITVTVPPDHPGGVTLGSDGTLRATATQLGEEGGQTVVNIRASRIVQLTILQNENPDYWANTAYNEPEKETKQIESTESVSETPTIETPSGALEIGSAPKSEEQTQDEGGGCLIATAAYGSEMANQVQLLREIRDDKLLTTSSGSSFMSGFNTLYYSFSPTIADLERENPMFREAVKVTITPLLTSLSILNHVDMDSEAEVLGYGISLILLNAAMYFVAPAIVIAKLRKRI